ncbi:hypothetical protein CP532_1080 [Ophiocordyceps camponoti-leonardi (nom. inval.)]|nr:hypothetical protein CP532_1080 [Ophiocordyceps camponoti-leonardi (nom. inval.)]
MCSSFKKSTYLESSIALSVLEKKYASEKAKLNPNPEPASTGTEAQDVKSLILIHKLLKLREKELTREHAATTPSHQFRAQVQAEARLRNPGVRVGVTYRDIMKPTKLAIQPSVEAVKERWIKQGIWKPEWSVLDMPGDQWKHETGPVHVHPSERRVDNAVNMLRILNEPRGRRTAKQSVERVQEAVKNLTMNETDPEVEAAARILMTLKKAKSNAATRREIMKISQEITLRDIRERESSRPLYQFVFQLCSERRRLSAVAKATDAVDVMAYENTKKTWMEDGLWDKNWGVVPGMSWKHEHPLQDFFLDDNALMEAYRLVDLKNGDNEEEESC